MINLKNYSKLRILLSIPLLVFAFIIIKIIIDDYSRVNYFMVIPYFIGVITFLLNKRWADYIAFAIFTFGFSGVIAFWFNLFGCLWCGQIIHRFLIHKPEEAFFLVLSILVLTFLLKNIFSKNK